MKNKKYIFLFAAIFLLLFACFSPLGYKSEDTTLSVGFGGALPRSAINPADLQYEITFSGPGGRIITETANYGETKTVQVVPGTWSISVEAFDPTDPEVTQAIGEAYNIDVRAGRQNNAAIKMAVYREVTTWAGLESVINDNELFDVFIVIKDSFAGNATSMISILNRTVTIAPESNSTITRIGFTNPFFSVQNNGHLIIGSAKYSGNLTLNGDGVYARIINIGDFGIFSMNGGVISGSNSPDSGGIANTGTFIMNNGTISGNSSDMGGGVANGGTFIMNGGTISGNGSLMGGGAVYNYGTFIMNSGEISGNSSTWLYGFGGGIHNSGTFTMNGGTISGNSATDVGSGVNNDGVFNISGSAFIHKNNEVYLAANRTINITGNLSAPVAATIRRDGGYTLDTQVLSGSTSLLSANSSRFRFFVNDVHLQIINNAGKLSRIIETVRINPGTFTRGSDDPLDNRAQPAHQVTLTQGFYMGKYQVTQEQYQAVMGSNPSYFNDGAVAPNRPVEMVSWLNAVTFCNILSEIEGLVPVYTIAGTNVTPNWNATGYRLPTEAEWEYACRAGTTTPWSHNEALHDNYAWYRDNSDNTTHPVGTKQANLWGLYDMHGNINEWCWDWFVVSYTENAQTNPTGPASGESRVIRGGSWYSTGQGLRSAIRVSGLPTYGSDVIGFRVVRP